MRIKVEEQRRLIEKNNGWIWKNVNAFSARQAGYGSIKCDRDDLYQECVLYVVEKFRRSGKTVEEFKVSNLDLLHCMCTYVQSLLPVTFPKTVRNFTVTMQKMNVTVDPNDSKYTQIIPDTYSEDAVFAADVSRFVRDMDERDQQIVRYFIAGYSLQEICDRMGIPRTSLCRARERIANKYRKYAEEEERKTLHA